MSLIYSIKSDVPEYRYDQYEVYEHIAPYIEPRKKEIFKKILKSTGIRQRYFSADLNTLTQGAKDQNVTQKFQIWQSQSLHYLKKQIQELLNESGLSPDQIDGICINTTTGILTPGLDVLLADEFNFRSDILRFPFFGFACAGGLISINRMADYLKLFPDKCFLVCCTETNTPHLQLSDTMSCLVHNSIFGDGFASILMVGEEHPLAYKAQVEIKGVKSELITQGKKSLSYTMENSGMRGRLSASLPEVVRDNVAEPVNALLEQNGLIKKDLDYVITHIGGPKVINYVKKALDINENLIDPSYEIYRNYGNQGAISVLNSLRDTLETNEKSGKAMFMVMGPGVCIELAYAKLTPWKKSDNQPSDVTIRQVSHGSKVTV